MSEQQQNTWIQIIGRQDKCIAVDTGTFRNIIRSLPNPKYQTPSLCFFLGQKHKNDALRCLFPHNNIKRAQQPCLARIRLANETAQSDRPLLFADSDLSISISDQHNNASGLGEKQFPIQWQCSDMRAVVDHVFARVLFATSNIIVIFVDDFNDLETLASDLLGWINIGVRSDAPVESRPRLLVVIRGRTQENNQRIWTLYKTLESHSSKRLSNLFSSVTTQYLEERELSDVSLYRPLKEEILRQMDEIRSALLRTKWLFSGQHIVDLTTLRLAHVAADVSGTLQTIQATRIYHEPTVRYTDYIAAFVQAALKRAVPYETMTSHIASALLLDAFPPGAHLFESETVFLKLYSAPCATALTTHFPPETVSFLVRQVLRRFQQHYEYLSAGKATAMELHVSNIRTQWPMLRAVFSKKTCMTCIGRAAQRFLPCGHSLCDVCVSRLGTALSGDEYYYEHRICLLCQHSQVCNFRVRPPTSGVRVWTIDGGGMRGVMPLEIIKLIQGILGPTLAIQDFFDYAAGTSSGGLIVLALFLLGWTPQKSSEEFERILRDLFGSVHSQRSSLTAKVMKAVRCWASDSRYDNAKVQSTLKNVFGATQPMFGHLSTIRGCKVAVTATSISDARCFPFTNYSSSASMDGPTGYKVVPHDDTKEPVMVWQAAQATTAAPVFFQPAHIPSYGSFQDGALHDNNPIDIALSECRRLWPTNSSPDLVVSLGTGTTESSSPKAPLFRDVLSDGFIPRLRRYLTTSFDGQKTWNALHDRVERASRRYYYRMNVKLDDVPAIDDVNRMVHLRNSVHSQPDGSRTRIELVGALITASFFFELDFLPEYNDGLFRCDGRIYLRNHSYGMVQALSKISPGGLAFLNDDGFMTSLDGIRDVCSQCHRFRKPVTFFVRDLSSMITIYLHGKNLPMRRISGFPQTVQWFITQQKLDAAFGTPDEIPRAQCGACENHTPKRKATVPVAECFPQKRRRPAIETSESEAIAPAESSFI